MNFPSKVQLKTSPASPQPPPVKSAGNPSPASTPVITTTSAPLLRGDSNLQKPPVSQPLAVKEDPEPTDSDIEAEFMEKFFEIPEPDYRKSVSEVILELSPNRKDNN